MLDERRGLKEIGKQAVWTLSTAKPGNGIAQLRDNNLETFWQSLNCSRLKRSDGPQPHFINIQFHKIVKVKEVAFYFDYKKDESYTPQRIIIRAGSSAYDLREIRAVEWKEPCGWHYVTFLEKDDDSAEQDETDESGPTKVISTNMIQIVVEANHQNGRDTHIRQIKIFGPCNFASMDVSFSTVEFSKYSYIR
ncbi:kinetochore component Apc10 [Acrasis kona]|uniref:Anaphase-promoting complex subunit 10 n=1 Tax=Acrasis kona TaxID=1008807 RepID=A0AAW2YWD3_9EUKA